MAAVAAAAPATEAGSSGELTPRRRPPAPQALGQAALAALQSQRESLQRSRDTLAGTAQDVKQAEKTVGTMERISKWFF